MDERDGEDNELRSFFTDTRIIIINSFEELPEFLYDKGHIRKRKQQKQAFAIAAKEQYLSPEFFRIALSRI